MRSTMSADADWWPEDSITRALRAAAPKPSRKPLVTPAEANRIIDELIERQEREAAERKARRA